MRELDLLLERFLARREAALDEAERRAVERLLDEPDQDILGWLLGASVPADPHMAQAVALIRETLASP